MGGRQRCAPESGLAAVGPCRRLVAARRRYCASVAAKLQERAELRLVGRAVLGWLQYTDYQAQRQLVRRRGIGFGSGRLHAYLLETLQQKT